MAEDPDSIGQHDHCPAADEVKDPDPGQSLRHDSSKEACALFFKQTSSRVYRAMLVKTRNRTHAEDAMATAFARAWEHWPELAHLEESQAIAWVITVAYRAYIDARRQWEDRVGSEPPELPGPEPSWSMDPKLWAEVLALPDRQREVVGLRDLARLTTGETANVLRISPGAVTAHLCRAHRTLRKKLDAWRLEGHDG